MTIKTASSIIVAVCAGALMGIEPVEAVEYDASIGYYVKGTNNAQKEPTDGQDETIYGPEANGSIHHETDRFSGEAQYNYQRRDYDKDTFPSNDVTTGRASVRWQAVKRYLSFRAMNTRSETTVFEVAQDTEDNRQQTETWTAGADFTTPIGASQQLLLGYTYRKYDADTSTGSESDTVNLGFLSDLSATRHVSLTGSYSQVEFDDAINEDLETWAALAQYQQESGRLGLNATAGYRWIERDDTDDAKNVEFRLRGSYKPSPDTQLSFGAWQYIDHRSDRVGEEARDEVEDPNDIIVTNTATTDVFTRTGVSADIGHEFGVNQVSAGITASDLDYENQEALNSRDVTARLSISRNLSRNSYASLHGSYINRDFEEIDIEDDIYVAEARFNLQLIRRLSLSLSLKYEERSSTEPLADYDETSGTIGLRYLLLERGK